MKEKPIIFSTPMVQAILEGRKTMTRRVMKPQPTSELFGSHLFWHWTGCQWADRGLGCPQSAIDDYAPYKPGDILWVRETFCPNWCDHVIYKADGGSAIAAGYAAEPKWKPSIHMPRVAARLFLEKRPGGAATGHKP